MKLSKYLSKKRGRAASLARSINAFPPDVSRWVKNENDPNYRPVPIQFCKAIEAATNNEVTCKDLRPNDWKVIWPELIEAA